MNEETATPGEPSTSGAARVEHRLDLLATVLLALATLATAWSAYQARVWTGKQSQAYSRATATRIAVNRESGVANRQVQIDVATFIAWVDAAKRPDVALARFYRQRVRAEFKPAFDAWIATDPLTSPGAPPTPFAMPQYKVAKQQESDRLEVRAAAISRLAAQANKRADDYMLAVVLFASAIFFAGLSTKLPSATGRRAVLALGWLLFVGAAVLLATYPVSFSG